MLAVVQEAVDGIIVMVEPDTVMVPVVHEVVEVVLVVHEVEEPVEVVWSVMEVVLLLSWYSPAETATAEAAMTRAVKKRIVNYQGLSRGGSEIELN